MESKSLINTENGPMIPARVEDLVICINKIFEVWDINPDGLLHLVNEHTNAEHYDVNPAYCTLLRRKQLSGDPVWPTHTAWEVRAS